MQFVSDPLKPNTAIEAKASYQLMRIFLGDTLDDIVDEIKYSLQGTTQGNGLTGSILPVRFSM